MDNYEYITVKKIVWSAIRRFRLSGPRATLQILVLIAITLVVPRLEAAGEVPTANSQSAPPKAPIAYYRYKIVRTYPHNARHFTQGLVYHDGALYEGTGLYGQSILTRRELKTNQIVKKSRLPRKYFGEGITLFGDRIIQLTWKSHTGFSYNRKTFRLLDEFRYDTEGWGLTHDGTRLILSDGTDTLRFLDPNTFAETGRLKVRSNGRPLRQINELEFIDGQIYANILPTDYIAIIAPQTGRVTGWIDLRGLYSPPPSASGSILNGIAYIPETKHLLVTGKLWPKMYEIELVRLGAGSQ